MEENTALEQAIQMFGSHAAFCRKLGLSRVAVYNWKRSGVPPERALQIEILTNGAITRQDLRPDLFGLTALATPH